MRSKWYWMVLGLGVLSVSYGQSAEATNVPTLDTVIAAWRANELAVKSGKFVWSERRVEPKGWKGEQGNRPNPPEDVTVNLEAMLVFDSNKTRYVTGLPETLHNLTDPFEMPEIRVFDGTTERIFRPQLTREGGPQGDIGRPQVNSALESSYIKPLAWAFRMSRLKADFQPRLAAVVHGEAILEGGAHAVVIEQHERFEDKITTFWVDPAQNYSIRRYYVTSKGSVIIDRQINYLFDRDFQVWIPAAWQFAWSSESGGSTTLISASCKLKTYTLNPTIDPKEFVLEFPPGTWVQSDTGDNYIQRPKGQKRRILKNEHGANYEMYRNTESGRAFSNSRIPNWMRYLLILVGGIGLAALLIRRSVVRRAKNAPSP